MSILTLFYKIENRLLTKGVGIAHYTLKRVVQQSKYVGPNNRAVVLHLEALRYGLGVTSSIGKTRNSPRPINLLASKQTAASTKG